MDAGVDWQVTLVGAGKIALAYFLALPIGWDREREGHSLGVRTFPLVAMASCAYALIGEVYPGNTADSQSRIIQGLITGIGFVGAGAIMKGPGDVHGTATAASIWNTGAIGAAVAMGRFGLATVLAILNLLTLRLLLPIKERMDQKKQGEHEGR